MSHLLLLLPLFLGCASHTAPPVEPEPMEDPAPTDGAITRLEYRFIDASVPPQYHRSFTISVTRSEVRRVTDSYGEILSDTAHPSTDEAFERALASYKAAQFSQGADSETPCTGGTSEVVRALSGDQTVFSASVSRCGGDRYGPLVGDIDGYRETLTALAPEDEGP